MTRNPWDPAAYPEHGDETPDSVFQAVGRALTEWELFEERLSWIFSLLMTGASGSISLPAIQAYGTIVAFQGRSQMVRASAEAYAAEHPETKAIQPLLDFLSLAGKYAARRNEIAHGIVQPFFARQHEVQREINLEDEIDPDGFALMPASYNTNKHGLARAEWETPPDFLIYRTPKYAYLSADIHSYRNEFSALRTECLKRWFAINHELWLAKKATNGN